MSRIGGTLTLDALRALHAPRTSEEIRCAVHEMRALGMGDYEISKATELDVEQVRRITGQRVLA